MICKEDKAKIDHWVGKFPTPKGAVLMALRILQDREGYLSDDTINQVADYLAMPKVDVYEVVSFYSMYRRKPGGKHYIKVCTSLSCCLTGASDVIKHMEEVLGISLGETTKDNKITLMETECLGACQGAPCAILDDTTYHLDLTPETVNELIKGLGESIDG